LLPLYGSVTSRQPYLQLCLGLIHSQQELVLQGIYMRSNAIQTAAGYPVCLGLVQANQQCTASQQCLIDV
jgi:hypothetical protein